ncbi:hypothetical protein ACFWDQ_11315 [Streptomyces sp. NPDC060053]|uniref:hypothetical protein n=1 Tax=Streptomyces sp. NPDC060053 TaxID=3347047 RepID=UPI003697F69A
MRFHVGTPPSRRRFLSLAADGVGVGTAALNGCALQVSSGASGPGETVTSRVKPDDISPELIKQAQKNSGVEIATVRYDITQLLGMTIGDGPPDLLCGVGSVDAPHCAARDVREELDR